MTRIAAFLCFLLIACSEDAPTVDPATMSWEQIEQAAHGSTVSMLTWTGDPQINRYMQGWVVPMLKEKHGIDLKLASVAGPRIVAFILAERETGKHVSEADLVWMAGRTSRGLREINALMGGLDGLPNYANVDAANPFIAFDYDIPINGFQVPWGQGQFMLITDQARVNNPPRSMAELEAWVRQNPGRFTLDAGFTTLGFLKALMVELAGGRDAFGPRFNEALYNELAPQLWAYLNRIRPYMWRNGEAFARSPAQMHQMFASGEIDFTMSYNDGETDAKIASGLFTDTSYGYVWRSGTPRNAHYLGVVANGANRAGAMVVANFLISQEAQLEKLRAGSWGDNTILNMDRLPPDVRQRFQIEGTRQHAPSLASVEDAAFRELHPDYIDRLYEDFLQKIVRGGS